MSKPRRHPPSERLSLVSNLPRPAADVTEAVSGPGGLHARDLSHAAQRGFWIRRAGIFVLLFGAVWSALTAAYVLLPFLDWHSLAGDSPRQDVDKFEADALAKSGFDTADVPPRYRSSYFLHIWSNGYAAGYYAYPWTRMLGQDAFDWFEKHGGLTRENGQRFRDLILSRGNTLDYAEMYRAWAGHDPSIEPYLEYYGLSGSDATATAPK